MVNEERLLELLGDDFYEQKGNIIHKCDNSVDDVIWVDEDLLIASSIPQLLGLSYATSDELNMYDEIFEKLDDSIFEVDIEKVKANLSKLGLEFKHEDADGDVVIVANLIIVKENIKYVEKMEIIPNPVYQGGLVYNYVLKASKEWGKQ